MRCRTLNNCKRLSSQFNSFKSDCSKWSRENHREPRGRSEREERVTTTALVTPAFPSSSCLKFLCSCTDDRPCYRSPAHRMNKHSACGSRPARGLSPILAETQGFLCGVTFRSHQGFLSHLSYQQLAELEEIKHLVLVKFSKLFGHLDGLLPHLRTREQTNSLKVWMANKTPSVIFVVHCDEFAECYEGKHIP